MRRCLPFLVVALLVLTTATAFAHEEPCPPGKRWWDLWGCLDSGYSGEPSTGVVGLPSLTQPANQPVRGIADIHQHQFANLGFGGEVFWGASFDPVQGINGALAWCDYTWDFPIVNLAGARTSGSGPGDEAHGPNVLFGQVFTHPVSAGTREGFHNVGGTGAFDGWPTFRTMTHQQMYYRWLERAYQGGLRLTVMLAVNNEAMCRASKKRQDWGDTVCDDMPAVDRQLQAAKDLEAFVDFEDNGARDSSGWYQIAYSPSQARQIIRDGKLAVILGIEVDSVFGCKWGTSGCDEAHVRAEAARYYAAGVRHIYPIHQFDNPFGGAAMFKNLLNTGNAVVTGHHFVIRNCADQGYSYNVGSDFFVELFAAALGTPFPNMAYYDQYPADCNVLGLTGLGGAAIDAFMDQRMIIDVDHMSRLMLDEVLAIAEARTPNPYPLVSGHTDFYDMAKPGMRSEFMLTPEQLQRIRNLGGMITATTLPHNDDLCYSSEDYARYYARAVAAMQGGAYYDHAAVAFSTDFGGWGMQPGPRFGRRWYTGEWCDDDGAPGLTYPFQGLFGGYFYPQVTGQRTFDFNVEGLAHVGLVPDLIADLKASGRVTDAELEPLYNSAEMYIRMWERIVPPPTITPHVTGTEGDHGWYRSNVTVTWSVTPNGGNAVLSTSGCGTTTISTDTDDHGSIVTCTATTAGGPTSASIRIKRDTVPPSIVLASRVPGPNANGWNDGPVTVTWTCADALSGADEDSARATLAEEGAGQTASGMCTDLAGNIATAAVEGIDIDLTAPSITSAIAPAANAAGWHNEDVTATFTATDALSGIDGAASIEVTFATDGEDQQATRTFTDKAGNEASHTSAAVDIDKTAPGISFVSRLPEANVHGWNNAAVTVTWACSDALSGAVDATVSDTRSGEGEAQTATGTCRDVADNTASATRDGISIDLTKPAIAWTIEPPANEAEWHNTDVTLTFTATDALSGIDGTPTSVFVFTTDSANHGGAAAFIDKAGNASALAKDGIKLDKTPPSIACLAAPAVLWPVNHKLVPVEVAFTFTDALSQAAAWSLITATSSEPDAGMGKDDAPGDIAGFPLGSMSLKGSLRAERTGQASQRTYTLGYRGFDVAGNSSECSTTVVVPHDQKK